MPWTLNVRPYTQRLMGSAPPALEGTTSPGSLGLWSSIPRKEEKIPGCLISVVKGYFWEKNIPATPAGVGPLASGAEGGSYVLHLPPQHFARCIATATNEKKRACVPELAKERVSGKGGPVLARCLSLLLLLLGAMIGLCVFTHEPRTRSSVCPPWPDMLFKKSSCCFF